MSEDKQNGNGQLVIESGIPLPDNRTKHGNLTPTILAMKVGDSFVYPKAKRGSILPVAQRHRIKIATRVISETEIRVWRIE